MRPAVPRPATRRAAPPPLLSRRPTVSPFPRRYERDPCVDGGNEWPCRLKEAAAAEAGSTPKTGRPTSRPATQSPIASSPVPSPTPEPRPQNGAGVGAMVIGQMTNHPSSQPGDAYRNGDVEETQASPPSPRPDTSYQHDDHPEATTVFILSLFQCTNVLPMNNEEQEVFSEVLMKFFRLQPSLQDASINIANVSVDRQQAVVGEIDVCSDGQKSVASIEDAKTIGISPPVDTTGMSMDVTTIVKRSSSLPSDFTDVLINYVIQENKAALIDIFLAEPLPYFIGVREISHREISQRISGPDSPSPSPPVKLEILGTRDNERNDGNLRSTNSASVIAVISVPWVLLALAFAGILYREKILCQWKKEQLVLCQNQESNDNALDEKFGDNEEILPRSFEKVSLPDSQGGEDDEGKAFLHVEEEKGKEGKNINDSTIKKKAARRMSRVRDTFEDRLRRKMNTGGVQRHQTTDDSEGVRSLSVQEEKSEEEEKIDNLIAKKNAARGMAKSQDTYDDRLRRKMKKGGAKRHETMNDSKEQCSSLAEGEKRKEDTKDLIVKKNVSKGMPKSRDTFDDRLRRKMKKGDAKRHQTMGDSGGDCSLHAEGEKMEQRKEINGSITKKNAAKGTTEKRKEKECRRVNKSRNSDEIV